jgi:hypothetical protein
MFPVRAKTALPIERLVIRSVAVRGQLGKMTVWVTNEENNAPVVGSPNTNTTTTTTQCNFRLQKRDWTMVYERKHRPSRTTYVTLDFADTPIVLEPGQVRMIYIHSTDPSDEAIVYDNSIMNPRSRSTIRYQDDKIAVHSGKAHLSPKVFGQTPIWGWGNAWRDRREFVGRIQYGVVYKLWSPERHAMFGTQFHAATELLLLAQRRDESPMAMLPDECIYYILNMCRWDWFEDNCRDLRRRGRIRRRLLEASSSQQAAQPPAAQDNDAMVIADNEDAEENEDGANGDDSDDEDFVDGDADDDDEDEDDDDDDDDNSNTWEHHNGYQAGTTHFEFHNAPSDDESSMEEDDDDDDDDQDADDNGVAGRQWHPWFGQNIGRRIVLRALGAGRNDMDL